MPDEAGFSQVGTGGLVSWGKLPYELFQMWSFGRIWAFIYSLKSEALSNPLSLSLSLSFSFSLTWSPGV